MSAVLRLPIKKLLPEQRKPRVSMSVNPAAVVSTVMFGCVLSLLKEEKDLNLLMMLREEQFPWSSLIPLKRVSARHWIKVFWLAFLWLILRLRFTMVLIMTLILLKLLLRL